ncbi:RmlC-like cupin [Decorospora gaudefroyi]|uniref:RmlC-like cupin n=1 Tax=Decorospora gaudefroyi TaxID=184978 RepID=A0A6A5K639_9PLEO|nr:RmlC-like cupin [Decorospora gaudefroyi]
MFTPIVLLTALLPTLITSASTTTPKSRTVQASLNSALRTAATAFDRAALLPNNEDWYYDFPAHSTYNAPTGAVINADAATFPALTGMGISIALLKLAPCGMLPPHLHPRATNLVTAITGNTTTYMIGENGVGLRQVDLVPLRVTIFPQGSLHMMQNNGCEEALLISALNSDDSGTLNILPALWSVSQPVIKAAFGDDNLNIEALGNDIPDVGTGAIIGSAECKSRCGI